MNLIPDSDIDSLRKKVIYSLQKQGFIFNGEKLDLPINTDKDALRQLHSEAVQTRLDKYKKNLIHHELRLLKYIADGRQVDPDKVSPRITLVESKSENELLFRYASLHWSIPVSSGYGRRMRFLIFDDNNDKLIGLVGLGDPVFSLAARDKWIGWTIEERKTKLKHVMDAFVLGAVPPYSYLLCGKLVATLIASNEVRNTFKKKYEGKVSLIKKMPFDGRLALVTTTSALGRSSLYNRVKYNERLVFKSIGYTSGSGDFHFSNGLYNEIFQFANRYCKPTAKQMDWGSGFRNKRELVRKVLSLIGLPSDLRYHTVKREIFVVPLAINTREFLIGKDEELRWYDMSVESIFEHFKERWLLPRAMRNKEYIDFRPSMYSLWM